MYIYIYTYIHIYIYIYNCIYPSIHPSVRLSVHPSIHPSIHASISYYLYHDAMLQRITLGATKWTFQTRQDKTRQASGDAR